MIFQKIVHSLIIVLGFWKLGELFILRVVIPLDRWQERRQVGRVRRAGWQREEEH